MLIAKYSFIIHNTVVLKNRFVAIYIEAYTEISFLYYSIKMVNPFNGTFENSLSKLSDTVACLAELPNNRLVIGIRRWNHTDLEFE